MDLMVLSVTFGVMAGVIQLVGYAVYVRLSNGHANTGTWLIWTLSAGVDLVSYDFITNSDLSKNILPAACATACVMTFTFLLVKGRFAKPDKTDCGMITADSAISIVWWLDVVTGITANLLLQATTLASALPMIRGLITGKEQERLLPWMLWTSAYIIHTGAVLLSLKHWSELVYPIVNVIMHGTVLVVAYKTRSPAM